MLEQHTSFNFLKSKVSDLAKIYQTNVSLIGKKKQKRCKFRRASLYGVIAINNIDAPFCQNQNIYTNTIVIHFNFVRVNPLKICINFEH